MLALIIEYLCQVKSFLVLWKLLWEWGNFGSSQVRAYLKLMLHLHATPSLIHHHSGSRRPSSVFCPSSQTLPLVEPHHFDELNIEAKKVKFISWKSADVGELSQSYLAIELPQTVKSSSLQQPFLKLDLIYCFQFYLPGLTRRNMSKYWFKVYQRLH